jgi:hypothetical protein
MTRWTCNSFRPVNANSAQEAATIFANRRARDEYGRKGYARTVRLDCWTEDRRDYTFEAFIGYSVGQGTTSGHNVWLHVHRVGAS